MIVIKEQPNRRYLYLTVFTGNLLAFIVGVSITWSSPVIPKLLNGTHVHNPLERSISTSEASWIGALYAVGGIFGPLLAGFVLDRFGRKKCALLCGGLVFAVSFFTIAFSKSLYLYYAGRFMVGIAASSIYTVIPLYNAEISEVSIRGKICSSISTFETAGELFSYATGPYLSIFWFCATIGIFATFATILGFVILPESPYYLMGKGDYLGAREALVKLRASRGEKVKDELEMIMNLVEESKTSKKGSLGDIFRSKALRKAQFMILGILTFQLLSGIIPIVFYSQSIFKESGSHIPPELCAMAIGITEFISSFITPNFVDRCGRKPLLIISACGMAISEFFLGLYFFLKYRDVDLDMFYWLPVLCLVGYIFSYIMGFGPMLWTMMGEIFPPDVKPAATTATCFIYWVLLFAMSKTFDFISDPLGIAVCFWVFAGSCVFAIVFVVTFVIETKGRDFQEIQYLLSR